jgi:hypothetical protein
MPASRSFSRREPYAGRGELIGHIRRIQAPTLELAELREQGRPRRELEAKELTLDQLRWRLATGVRRTAADAPGAAA